jgi:hypothetical protein
VAVGTYATLTGLRTRLFGPGAGPSENDALLGEVCDEVNDFIEGFTRRVLGPIPAFSASLTANAGERVATLDSSAGLAIGDQLLIGALDDDHEVAVVLARTPDLSQVGDWEGETGYALDEVVEPDSPNGHTYVCVKAGDSGSVEPTWPTDGSAVIDGDVVWLDRGLTSAAITFRSNLTYGYSNAPCQRIAVLDGLAALNGRRLHYQPGIVALAAVEFADGTLPTDWRLEPTSPPPGRPHTSVGLTNGTRFPTGRDDVRLIGPGPCVDLDDAPAFGYPLVPDAIRTVAYNLCAGRWQMKATGGAYEIAPGTDQVQVGAFMLTRTDYDTLRSFRPRWSVS